MFYAWRLNEPGTTPPSLEEVHKNGIPVPGKRVISHIGTVDMIYELGILGFLIFVWLIVAASWYAIRFLWQPGPEDEMKVVVIAGLALFLGILAANSTVATLLIFRPIAVAFFMGLGLIAEGSRQLEKPETLSFISTSYTGC